MSLMESLLLDPHRINIWLAIRTDGNKGCGTQSDPYDASTEARFDSLMDSFDEFTTVHLGPGVFRTTGYSDDEVSPGWQPKKGMKIIGSGMDVTTIQLVGAGGDHRRYFAIGHELASGSSQGVQVDCFEASDFTIDCNLNESGGNLFARGAARIKGNHARLRRTKAINWGTKSSQRSCYVFSLVVSDPEANIPEVENIAMEECIAVEPANGAGVLEPATMFHAGTADESAALQEFYGINPFIRNCFGDGEQISTPSTKDFRGISMCRCTGGVVEGTEIHNCKTAGPYQENTSTRELTIRNNFFNNIEKGCYLNLGQLHPATAESLTALIRDPSDNSIALATTSLSDHGLKPGERVKVDASGSSPGQFKGHFIIKNIPASNQFRYQMDSAPTQDATSGTFQKVMGVARLIFEYNSIEMASGSEGDLGIHIHDAGQTGQSPDFVHGEVIVRDNKVGYVSLAFDSNYLGSGMELNGIKNLKVHDNVVSVQPANPLRNSRSRNVNYFNNKTPGGTLVRGFKADTDQKYNELETDAEDALVLALFNRK